MKELGDRTPPDITPIVPREAMKEAGEIRKKVIFDIFERSISLKNIKFFDPALAYTKIADAKRLGMREYREMKQRFLALAGKIENIDFDSLDNETAGILLDKIKEYFKVLNKDNEIGFRPEDKTII